MGHLNLQCQLLPHDLWNADRIQNLYLDDPEANRQIILQRVERHLPADSLELLVDEIALRIGELQKEESDSGLAEKSLLLEIRRRLTVEGNNPYPRVVALPRISFFSETGNVEAVLRVFIGPSRYGIALVEERRLTVPAAVRLRSRYILNSLSVRVALTYPHHGSRWVEFHQRKGGPNATYKDSWNVGAAGYLDPLRHKDPEDESRISPWQGCACELAEELAIPPTRLPHRDHYYFLGMGRNDPTGQLDILAYCDADLAPDPKRSPTARVSSFDRCVLNPESVASFLLSKKRWVPTAILTMIPMLEAFGFSIDRIERAFAPLVGQLDLNP